MLVHGARAETSYVLLGDPIQIGIELYAEGFLETRDGSDRRSFKINILQGLA